MGIVHSNHSHLCSAMMCSAEGACASAVQRLKKLHIALHCTYIAPPSPSMAEGRLLDAVMSEHTAPTPADLQRLRAQDTDKDMTTPSPTPSEVEVEAQPMELDESEIPYV